MQGVPGVEAMEMLIKRLKATKSNAGIPHVAEVGKDRDFGFGLACV